MYIVGLIVKKLIELIAAFSSLVNSKERSVKPSSKCTFTFSSAAFCSFASLSPPFAFLALRKIAFSALSISASTSSVLITSISSAGSIVPATCITFSSSKQRTTWPIASVSRMFAKNWLPKPSPLDAPFTKPAISTNSILVVRMRCGFTILASSSRRGSGTGTTPVLGSMVQKGKLAASIPALVSALKSVDLPTLGKPTMPHLKPIVRYLVKIRLNDYGLKECSLFCAFNTPSFASISIQRTASSTAASIFSWPSLAAFPSTQPVTISRCPG